MGHVKSVEIGAIIPPALPSNVKFDITSALIQLLKLKGIFLGADIDDANTYHANFVGI